MPVCDETQDVVYGVSENESVSVSCSVNSYPPADAFTWSFNNSLTSTLLPTSSFTSSPGRSVINYTPHSHMDFGTLLCWGTNMVGNQQTNRPCVFHIIPTGTLATKGGGGTRRTRGTIPHITYPSTISKDGVP